MSICLEVGFSCAAKDNNNIESSHNLMRCQCYVHFIHEETGPERLSSNLLKTRQLVRAEKELRLSPLNKLGTDRQEAPNSAQNIIHLAHLLNPGGPLRDMNATPPSGITDRGISSL